MTQPIQLSVALCSLAAQDPGSWTPMLECAPLIDAGATGMRASFIPLDPSEAEDLLAGLRPHLRVLTDHRDRT